MRANYLRSSMTCMFPISFSKTSLLLETSFSSSMRFLRVRLSWSQRSWTYEQEKNPHFAFTATQSAQWHVQTTHVHAFVFLEREGLKKSLSAFWVSISCRMLPMSLLIFSRCFSASVSWEFTSWSSASFCWVKKKANEKECKQCDIGGNRTAEVNLVPACSLLFLPQCTW